MIVVFPSSCATAGDRRSVGPEKNERPGCHGRGLSPRAPRLDALTAPPSPLLSSSPDTAPQKQGGQPRRAGQRGAADLAGSSTEAGCGDRDGCGSPPRPAAFCCPGKRGADGLIKGGAKGEAHERGPHQRTATDAVRTTGVFRGRMQRFANSLNKSNNQPEGQRKNER